MIWIILGAAVVLLLVWFVVLYNGVRRAALKVDEAEAGIDASCGTLPGVTLPMSEKRWNALSSCAAG